MLGFLLRSCLVASCEFLVKISLIYWGPMLEGLYSTSCELSVASCELSLASWFFLIFCELRVASCELRVASCELRVASCKL